MDTNLLNKYIKYKSIFANDYTAIYTFYMVVVFSAGIHKREQPMIIDSLAQLHTTPGKLAVFK